MITPLVVIGWLIMGFLAFWLLLGIIILLAEYVKSRIILAILLTPVWILMGASVYYAAKYLILLGLIK